MLDEGQLRHRATSSNVGVPLQVLTISSRVKFVYVQDVRMPNFMSIIHQVNVSRWRMIAHENHMQGQTKNDSKYTIRGGMLSAFHHSLGVVA